MNNAMSVAEIRTQERHQLPKILAGGIGFSLLIHLLAAIAFNHLPMPIPEEVVEVTMIDASELPLETRPEPRPTVSINTNPKVPSPAVPLTPSITPPLPAPPVIKSAIEPIPRQAPTPLINPVLVSPTKIAKKSIARTKKIQRSPRSQVSATNRVSPSIGQSPINEDMISTPFMSPTTPPIDAKPLSVPKKPGKILDKPIAPGSIAPVSLNQTSTSEQSNSSSPPFTAPISRPQSQINPSPQSIDPLDQQDDLDLSWTDSANNSPPVKSKPVRPSSSPGQAIKVPSIAGDASLHNSSHRKNKSIRPLGQSPNTGGVTSNNQNSSPLASRTPSKGSSTKGSNSNPSSSASNVVGSGQGSRQAATNGRDGEVAKSGNNLAATGMTLRCAPDSNCKPPYPEEAQGAKGVTVLEILLADDGSVSSAQVADSSGNNLFDKTAVETAPNMRFVLPPGRQRKFRVAIKFMPEAG